MTEREKLGTFNVTKNVYLPEIQSQLIEFVEEGSQATVLYLQNEDPEKVFSFSFATHPQTSNGVAHILEHTVLCGSAKYPVKDPFFSMRRRSLQTFMNAMTGGDFTCYPAATLNKKDFFNLLDVYLDAVFYPDLGELCFLQEGHRLEFSTPEDPSSPLEYKGIVFNEMKGALSTPLARLHERMQRELFPGITYSFNSGGDPKEIVHLTHQELKEFHKTYYHPSRCLFYVYGQLPIEEYLEVIYERVLKGVKPLPPMEPIPPVQRFTAPKRLRGTYPLAKEESLEDKTMVSVGVVTAPCTEQLTSLALFTLAEMLLDHDASPLKKALLQAGVCRQVLYMMDAEASEMPLQITLLGVPEGKEDLALDVFDSVVQEIASTPFSREMIDNALHQIEFSRLEISDDHYPYGLELFFRAALLKQQGGEPEDALKVHSLFAALRDKLENEPLYFNELMQTYLVNNPHRVSLSFTPDTTLQEKEEAEERAALEERQKKLTSEEKKTILEKTKLLEEWQNLDESETIGCLPKVSLDDVSPEAKDYSVQTKEHTHLTSVTHTTFTNDIVYASLVFDLSHIEMEELPYVRLISQFMTQVGSKNHSYESLLSKIQGTTGGVSASIDLYQQAENPKLCDPSLEIHGRALFRNVQDLFSIFQELGLGPVWQDKRRLKELLEKHFTGLQNSLVKNSVTYARLLGKQHLHVPGYLEHQLFGLGWYWQVKEWMDTIDVTIETMIEKLSSVTKRLLQKRPTLVLTCQEEHSEKLEQETFYNLGAWNTSVYPPFKGTAALSPSKYEALAMSASVAFCTRTYPAVGYTEKDAPLLTLASKLMNHKVLHALIREQGGAYGGGSGYETVSGSFFFYSYRDPQIVKTYEAFDEALQTILSEEITEEELEEAKIETLQQLDHPVAVGQKALTSYGWRRSGLFKDRRNQFRQGVLEATQEQICSAVNNHLNPAYQKGKPVVFAGVDLFTKEQETHGTKFEVYSVEEKDERLL